MHQDGLDIIAPAALGGEFCEAEVFGCAVWLWMHSDAHHDAPLHLLSALLLPAIKSGQFVVASESSKPVFYLSWARLSEQAERRYLDNPPQFMPREDWVSGNRLWVLDWIAPFGHTRRMRSLLARQLFADRCMRGLDHRGAQRGLRVKEFHGIAVTPQEARSWFERHPLSGGNPR